eukprot:Nk52_evm1s894 gene=Nk52_evmTU1s894
MSRSSIGIGSGSSVLLRVVGRHHRCVTSQIGGSGTTQWRRLCEAGRRDVENKEAVVKGSLSCGVLGGDRGGKGKQHWMGCRVASFCFSSLTRVGFSTLDVCWGGKMGFPGVVPLSSSALYSSSCVLSSSPFSSCSTPLSQPFSSAVPDLLELELETTAAVGEVGTAGNGDNLAVEHSLHRQYKLIAVTMNGGVCRKNVRAGGRERGKKGDGSVSQGMEREIIPVGRQRVHRIQRREWEQIMELERESKRPRYAGTVSCCSVIVEAKEGDRKGCKYGHGYGDWDGKDTAFLIQSKNQKGKLEFCQGSYDNRVQDIFSGPGNDEPTNKRNNDLDDFTKLSLVAERLRTELPLFFENGHKVDPSLYDQNLLFKEYMSGLSVSTNGLSHYKMALQCFRGVGKAFLMDCELDVVSLRKIKLESTVKVRWCAHGVTRSRGIMNSLAIEKGIKYLKMFKEFRETTKGSLSGEGGIGSPNSPPPLPGPTSSPSQSSSSTTSSPRSEWAMEDSYDVWSGIGSSSAPHWRSRSCSKSNFFVEGVSTFYVNKEGKIFKHIAEKLEKDRDSAEEKLKKELAGQLLGS